MEPTSLDTLFPTNVDVTIRGETMTIKPWKAGKLPRVMKEVKPIFGLLAEVFATQNIGFIVELIAEGGDNILNLVALTTDKPREWVDDLEQDELIDIASVMMGVNSTFFVQKILPKIKEKTKSLTQGIPG